MASPAEMTCKELVELITDYLEGAMGAPEQQRFELHLNQCSGCRVYLAQIQQTIQSVGRLSEESLSPAARDQLLHVFRNWKKK